MDSEPIYDYVPGQGWVATVTVSGRVFQWNNKTWIITEVTEAQPNTQTWRNDRWGNHTGVLTMSNGALTDYAYRHWSGRDPGVRDKIYRTARADQIMLLFTEVK